MKPFRKVTGFSIQNSVKRKHIRRQNPVMEWFYQALLSFFRLVYLILLDIMPNNIYYWSLNRGRSNRRSLIGTVKKLSRPLNSDRLKVVFVYLFTMLYWQQFLDFHNWLLKRGIVCTFISHILSESCYITVTLYFFYSYVLQYVENRSQSTENKNRKNQKQNKTETNKPQVVYCKINTS